MNFTTKRGTAKRSLAKKIMHLRQRHSAAMLKTTSPTETVSFAERLGKRIKPGLVCLYGDLGAGKTTFVRGLAKGLGVKSRVQSPTFTYQRIHRGKKTLYHFDCYRLTGRDELLVQEIQEAVAQKNSVVVIEWAEKVEKFLPKARLEIQFRHIDETSRELEFNANNI